jgi:hypothetical protein
MKGRKYPEIIDYLIQRGIRKKFLADKLLLSYQYLYQMLQGKRNMPDEVLERINIVLKTEFKHPEEPAPISSEDKPLFKDDK